MIVVRSSVLDEQLDRQTVRQATREMMAAIGRGKYLSSSRFLPGS
jgi:hypothetical protein